jgi:hypothetical protein
MHEAVYALSCCSCVLAGPGLVRGRLVRGRLTMKPKVDRKFVLSI